MFSSAFSSAFAHGGERYIGPAMAQAALVAGGAWSVFESRLFVGGQVLVGPAGKVFAFASPETAARWAENARGASLREAEIISGMDEGRAAAWKARKREKLAVIAGHVVAAAARQANDGIRAALIAEADFCLAKWGPA